MAASLALLPLACWPGLDRPFSLPKLWIIAAAGLLVVVQQRVDRPPGRVIPGWAWLSWLAAVSLSAATAPIVVPAAFLLAVLPLPLSLLTERATHAGRPRCDVPGVAEALCIGSAAVSVVAVLQYAGHDPFAWFGWHPEAFASSRMRVYATLGNPDFVAAWLSATLPLAARMPARWRPVLVPLQLAAIVATGSRVALVALPVAAVTMLAWAGRPDRRWCLAALAAVALALVLIGMSPARPLGTTVRGRLYLVRVTASHLLEVPAAGYGPGAFEAKFAGWQDEWLRGHAADARFAGVVDHAHNDYLEFWVEYGPLGFCVFLFLCARLLVHAWHHDNPAAPGALAALLAIACVDFPFHRPAEWALFAVLAGLTRRID